MRMTYLFDICNACQAIYRQSHPLYSESLVFFVVCLFLNGATITVRSLGILPTQACLISELRRVLSTCEQFPPLQPSGRRGGFTAARTPAPVYPSYRAVHRGPLPRVLCISEFPNLHVVLLCFQGNFNPLCHIELQVNILERWGHRLLSDRIRRGHL